PNEQFGVFVNNSPNALIVGNLISANGIAGINLFGVSSTGDSVQGNNVSTDFRGTAAFLNPTVPGMRPSFNGPIAVGTQKNGVVVIGGPRNFIGTDQNGGGLATPLSAPTGGAPCIS